MIFSSNSGISDEAKVLCTEKSVLNAKLISWNPVETAANYQAAAEKTKDITDSVREATQILEQRYKAEIRK